MRPALLAFMIAAVTACSASGPPRSEYFVVPFEAGDASLQGPAKAVIAQAARAAGRGGPQLVAVKGYLSADGAGRELSEQRMRAVEEALVGGGVPKPLVQIMPQTVAPENFARLGN